MAEALLQVKDLIKEYEGNRILDGVNLEIEQGQVVVVVGPSGCGRTYRYSRKQGYSHC